MRKLLIFLILIFVIFLISCEQQIEESQDKPESTILECNTAYRSCMSNLRKGSAVY